MNFENKEDTDDVKMANDSAFTLPNIHESENVENDDDSSCQCVGAIIPVPIFEIISDDEDNSKIQLEMEWFCMFHKSEAF